jgi:pyruvate decarboxylase
VKIGKQRFDVKMVHVLTALVQDLKKSPLVRASTPTVDWDPYPMNNPEPEPQLTQDYLWPVSLSPSNQSVNQALVEAFLTTLQTLGKFFKPGDFIIGETGTSAFGLGCSKLPSGASMYNQTIFGSIGYATGAALGAFKAIRESGKYKRCILVTGEGSLHLTVQTFADLLKLGLNPIVFVLNNDGYTVERLIHGKDA